MLAYIAFWVFEIRMITVYVKNFMMGKTRCILRIECTFYKTSHVLIQVLLRRLRQGMDVLQSPHFNRAQWQGLPHGLTGHLRALGKTQSGNGSEETI